MSLSPLCCWDASWQLLAGSCSDAVSQVRAVSEGQHHSHQLTHLPVWGHGVGTAGANPVTPQTTLPTNPAHTAAWAAPGSTSPSHLQSVQQSFLCLSTPEACVLWPLAPWQFWEAAPRDWLPLVSCITHSFNVGCFGVLS